MSAIKFPHVFAGLLLLSTLSAFFIPKRFTAKAEPQVQALFYPVAKPVRSIAGWVDERFSRPEVRDSRDRQAIIDENEMLRQEYAALSRALEEASRRNNERERVGMIREFCTPFAVVGTDAAGRAGLLIRGSTLEGLREGQFVLAGSSVAGIIDKPPGLAGAEVRLITDRGLRVGASFVRAIGPKQYARIETSPALVEGTGDGAMRCATDLTMEEIRKAGLQNNDLVVVDDNDWDRRMQGRVLGRVVRVDPQTREPLFAEIRVEPSTNLTRLREVMVLTK